jgi:heterodisulfide reductase subunit B
LRVAQEEARADMMVGHDTGCITTLDKNQWIGAAVGKPVEMPVLADCQFAALVCGAHPYKIVQSHQAKKKEFEDYLKEVEAGRGETLYDPRLMITSGPGYKAVEHQAEE